MWVKRGTVNLGGSDLPGLRSFDICPRSEQRPRQSFRRGMEFRGMGFSAASRRASFWPWCLPMAGERPTTTAAIPLGRLSADYAEKVVDLPSIGLGLGAVKQRFYGHVGAGAYRDRVAAVGLA